MGRGAGARSSSEEVEVRGAMGDLLSAGSTISGCLVMIALSYQFSRYLSQLHENDLWRLKGVTAPHEFYQWK